MGVWEWMTRTEVQMIKDRGRMTDGGWRRTDGGGQRMCGSDGVWEWKRMTEGGGTGSKAVNNKKGKLRNGKLDR